MTKICEKHKSEPAIIYGECVGCEIDRLQAEVERLRNALAYGKALGMEHDADVIERVAKECGVKTLEGYVIYAEALQEYANQLRQQAKEIKS